MNDYSKFHDAEDAARLVYDAALTIEARAADAFTRAETTLEQAPPAAVAAAHTAWLRAAAALREARRTTGPALAAWHEAAARVQSSIAVARQERDLVGRRAETDSIRRSIYGDQAPRADIAPAVQMSFGAGVAGTPMAEMVAEAKRAPPEPPPPPPATPGTLAGVAREVWEEEQRNRTGWR